MPKISMVLSKIRIVGYKSIDDLTFDIKKINDSFTTILLGINESGKSNVLDAMFAINMFYEDKTIKYRNVKSRYSENERTSVYYTYDLVSGSFEFPEDIKISSELFYNLDIKDVIQEIYIEEGQEKYSEKIHFKYDKNLNINLRKEEGKLFFELDRRIDSKKEEYMLIGTNKSNAVNTFKDINGINKYLEDSLNKIIALNIHKNKNRMNASIWKPQPEYTICENIQLDTFSQNPNAYPLLKNIFSLCDYTDKLKISQKISEIRDNSARCNTLEKKLSNATTTYIKEKWPELNVSFNIRISKELFLDMHVFDNDSDDTMYLLKERSEGFKQFISMLLSICIDNQNGEIRNKLILIDEPEVHLHPSGIRYMQNELLKIGQNNFVFIATHSNFMVDVQGMERHYIIKKHAGKTKSRRIESYEDIRDDEILSTAFGINYLKDLTSPYKMIVEGMSDKVIFEKVINYKRKKNDIVIAIGMGKSVDTIASIIAGYDVYPTIVVDSDSSGRESKSNILSRIPKYDGKIYTISDLYPKIIENGSIEDLLDLDYIESIVKPILEENSVKNIIFTSNAPICKQIEEYVIKIQKVKKKEMMDHIKTEISNNLEISNNKHPKLLEFTDTLIEKVIQNSQ